MAIQQGVTRVALRDPQSGAPQCRHRLIEPQTQRLRDARWIGYYNLKLLFDSHCV